LGLLSDTFANINEAAFDVNIDAVAYATLQYAMNASAVNGVRWKGPAVAVLNDRRNG
jgi:hypothetical protein